MYLRVRLTHIVLLYNQSDGLRLSEQFSLVICYFKTIFIAYNYCNATLRCPAAIYYAALSLSLALYNIVLLVPSSAPHIKVILPPNSTSQEVTLIIIHLGNGGYQFKNIKYFSIIINKAVMED